jgi:hypothetical protein
MLRRLERAFHALCIGPLVMATTFFAAMYVWELGATSLAEVLLWPSTLAVGLSNWITPVETNPGDLSHHAKDAVALFIGFPLGSIVYAGVAYFVMSKWGRHDT